MTFPSRLALGHRMHGGEERARTERKPVKRLANPVKRPFDIYVLRNVEVILKPPPPGTGIWQNLESCEV